MAIVLHTSYFLIKDAISADHAMISAWLGAGMFKRKKITIESGALFGLSTVPSYRNNFDCITSFTRRDCLQFLKGHWTYL